MRIIFKFLILGLISINSAYSQSNAFFNFIVKSDSLYKISHYNEIIDLYNNGKRYQSNEFNYRMNDYYFMACCYAKLGDKRNAFKSLNILIDKYDYSDTSIFRDKDLDNIKNDIRWAKFKTAILTNLKEVESLRIQYAKLKLKLDSLYIIDQLQTSYLDIENLKKYDQHGKDSINKEVYQAAKNRSIEVMDLLDGVPWLNKHILGVDAFEMIFLSVQHSGDINKMEYLLNRYKKYRQTPVDYAHFAMLYDRFQTKKDKKQRYGTQIIININTGKKYYLQIEDLNRVNEYRRYCYFDSIQDDMKWHNMTVFIESSREEQENIK